MPLVGSTFTAGAGALMMLTAIRDLTPQPVKERGNVSDGRFSLLFTSASVMAQGTRTLGHPTMGESALFVVPVGTRTTPATYEVIVNRLA